MFLHMSVILLTGGGLRAGRTPPAGRPPQSRHPPGADTTPPPPGADPPPPRSRHPHPPSRHPPEQTPPPPESRLQHTFNERPVRILLECILVFIFTQFSAKIMYDNKLASSLGNPGSATEFRAMSFKRTIL